MARRWMTLLLVLGLMGTSLLAGTAQAVDGKAPVWAPKFQDGKELVPLAQAEADARSFDVIAAVKGAYEGQVGAMKAAAAAAANKNFKTLVYMNAVFAQEPECPPGMEAYIKPDGAENPCDGKEYPEAWYARDANNNYVQSVRHGNWLMNPTDSPDPTVESWVDDRVATCAAYREEGKAEDGSGAPYDGCMIDVLGTAAVQRGFVTSQPVNPETATVYTKDEWLNATTNIAKAVQAATDGPVYGNGLGNGEKYFGTENTERILEGLDGGWAENFLRSGARSTPLTSFPTEEAWKADVDMVADVSKPLAQGGNGKPILTTTKLWIDTADEVLKHQWHRFALGSFMLGKTGPGWFSISYNDGQAARTFYGRPASEIPPVEIAGPAYWNKKLGPQQGNYTKLTSGVYQRVFLNGKVVVNPTTQVKTVSVGPTAMCNISGKKLAPRTTIQLGPGVSGDPNRPPGHDAQILTKPLSNGRCN